MPITPFLRDPETVEVMGRPFNTTCEALGLTEREDAMTKLVAEKIIELAQRGFKNPLALHLAAMTELESHLSGPPTSTRPRSAIVSSWHLRVSPPQC